MEEIDEKKNYKQPVVYFIATAYREFIYIRQELGLVNYHINGYRPVTLHVTNARHTVAFLVLEYNAP